jgi:hypothetical protein
MFDVTEIPTGVLGQPIQFRIQVTNLGGYYNTSYEHLSVIVADIPTTPPAGPAIDYSFTDATRLKVDLTEPYNGGSVLTNYEVQMDEGLGQGFITIFGGDLGQFL